MNTNTLQLIRLADIFIIAPIMFNASTQVKSKNLSRALVVLGISTVAFNGFNFIKEAQKR